MDQKERQRMDGKDRRRVEGNKGNSKDHALVMY
ncbi:hypothetical protein FOIG_01081 [Fusarium odoratissimum NRRL 54006]|uniref:Uncharacterized protein n=1 Tax=Fusarium odoratissimum (strain NRRL 54006) TaxID=1089451 RepID=X0KRT2_FUSO5|nr:uncharacterized protein FOIG_01081 [Fusarium odoratissimum NRRL 54006]EXM11391.1 hypothetical protein FOIG_01081 [Fusarium odoratissimum NRRL 54006]